MTIRISPLMSGLKFLDQPVLLYRFGKLAPNLLRAGGLGYLAYDTIRAPEGERGKRAVKTAAVLLGTIEAGLWGMRKFRPIEPHNATKAVKEAYKLLTEGNKPVSARLNALLQKAKSKILTPQEVHALRTEIGKRFPKVDKFLDKTELIPEPENIGSDKIFGEIRDLSLLGLFPVLGGIGGGVLGNLINRDNWKGEFKNQAKEGLYQYLANIVLCNVGAGIALLGLEKAKLSGRGARFFGMMGGIMAFGVIGGSNIANFFGKNFFNPLFDKGPTGTVRDLRTQIANQGIGSLFKDLNAERKPELMDVGLHVDDVATVGVLSGLKWIEPALPFLYALSGFRSGIGYRNGKAADKPHAKAPTTESPAANPFTTEDLSPNVQGRDMAAFARSRASYPQSPPSPAVPWTGARFPYVGYNFAQPTYQYAYYH